MINHISIAVNEPERVANALAEVWDGIVFPFPPAPGSFFVLANDGRGIWWVHGQPGNRFRGREFRRVRWAKVSREYGPASYVLRVPRFGRRAAGGLGCRLLSILPAAAYRGLK